MPEKSRCVVRLFYKHFAELFRSGWSLDHSQALRDLLDGDPRHSVRNAEFCEEPITVVEVVEVLGDCAGQSSPGHDGLSY